MLEVLYRYRNLSRTFNSIKEIPRNVVNEEKTINMISVIFLFLFLVFWSANLRQSYHHPFSTLSCSRPNDAQRRDGLGQRASFGSRTLLQLVWWEKGRPCRGHIPCRKTFLDGGYCWGCAGKFLVWTSSMLMIILSFLKHSSFAMFLILHFVV